MTYLNDFSTVQQETLADRSMNLFKLKWQKLAKKTVACKLRKKFYLHFFVDYQVRNKHEEVCRVNKSKQ